MIGDDNMGRPAKKVKCEGVTLYTDIDGRVIRVAQDNKKKQKITNYKLMDSKKSQYISQTTDLDEMKDWYDKYVADLKEKIDIPMHEMLPTKITDIKLIWINIREDDRQIQETLFRFYQEEDYLKLLDDPEEYDYNTIDDLDDGECQTVYLSWMVKEIRENIKKEPEYEPYLYNLNTNTNECYIIYNLEKNQDLLLEDVCDYHNDFFSVSNNMPKEELKEELFQAGVVTKDNREKGKKYWGEDVQVLTDKEFESHYFIDIIKKRGDGLIKARRQITPRFIITEFVKLLKNDPDTVVNISGIKEFGYLKDIKPKKTITLKEVGEYYFNRHKYRGQKKQSEKWINIQRNWWREFLDITQVTTLDNITPQTINDYNMEVCKVIKDNNYFPKWLSDSSKNALKKKPAKPDWATKRINAINSIFRNMLKITDDIDSINKVLGHLEKLDLSKADLHQE